MTRDTFIKKWLTNKDVQYTEQFRDEMRDDLDKIIACANDVLPHVSQRSEQLVNFLWEQYKVNRLITKKAYLQMVANARKLTNCG